ncbi:S41 family peptidase [Maribacter aurantiacus]|uniref:Uncharacterized protein n=1 Tax=Maribacter aurantiacus TaxID=1882343 RepID=A0A5R8M731_9FLAO|nr:S41 family peptidase [Maribacter aurantiacus]TLF45295.1 hypothetical protein FEK29_07880 [Maribacter aurantiacus]
MKKIIPLIFTLSFFIITAQEVPSIEDWRNDLEYLHKKVHNDYPFLFVKTTEDAFDIEVEKLHGLIPTLEPHEIIIGFSRIIALFKYGHMAVGFNIEPFEFHYLPINLYQFSDGIYLQGVHKNYQDVVGSEVIEINGIPIIDALKKVYPVVSAENSQYFKSYGINYLTIMEVLHAQGITNDLKSSIEFTLERNGETFKKVFDAMPKGQTVPRKYGFVFEDDNWSEAREQNITPLYLEQLDKMYFFKYLSEKKTVFVRLSQIEDDPNEDMESFYARLFDFVEKENVEKLIIDVRLNGGGNNFKNRTLVTKIIENKKINRIGNLFVILGRRTFSACQNLVNELDNYTNVIFLGEPTSENINFYGDSRPVILPHTGHPVYLSYAWWQDKPAWQNAKWLAPSIPVEMSFEEYSTNDDPILKTGLDFSDKDFKPNPMRYITDLFVRGEIQQLDQVVPQMINDPKYDFFDFEKEISKAGHHLIQSGRASAIQAGIAVFSFVTRLFPNSPSAWENLATGQMKAGHNENAKKSIKKAMALDLEGNISKRIQELLKNMPD